MLGTATLLQRFSSNLASPLGMDCGILSHSPSLSHRPPAPLPYRRSKTKINSHPPDTYPRTASHSRHLPSHISPHSLHMSYNTHNSPPHYRKSWRVGIMRWEERGNKIRSARLARMRAGRRGCRGCRWS
jgi:hypothetical protein